MRRKSFLAGALLPLTAAASKTLCTVNNINVAFSSVDNAEVVFAIPLGANSSFGQLGDIAFPINATYLPQSCAVLVNVTTPVGSSYTFGLFLPEAKEWNKRTLTVGNSGFVGGVNWLAMGDGLKYGFASVSTDTGHNSTGIDMAWALNKPESKTDWAYRALHGSVVLAKKIVGSYYDEQIRYNYYSGCSTGGRQGIKSAQDFPEDFDGVLAGAPAWWSTHQQLWQLKVGAVNLPETSPGFIPLDQFSWISDAVLAQCDGSDGLEDGIIQNPAACHLRIGELICTDKSTNKSQCLTAPQAETLRQLYLPMTQIDAESNSITNLYPNFGVGSEMQMPSSFGMNNTPSPYGTDYAKYYILDDPDWDWATSFNYSTWVDADRLNPGNVNALSFNMSAFHSSGGKLLTYHGWADGLIPPGASSLLYDNVQTAMAPRGVEMDDFYRLFMVPGMQHCQQSVYDAPWYFGGSGHASTLTGTSEELSKLPLADANDSRHDALLALMEWVENEKPVEYLVATKWRNDSLTEEIVRRRPLCSWPKQAVYKGQGDVNKASNWRCR